jgi:hypothetical protein
MNTLRDPIWQYISVVIGIVGIIISLGHPEIAFLFAIVIGVLTSGIMFVSYLDSLEYSTSMRIRMLLLLLCAMMLLYISQPTKQTPIFVAAPQNMINSTPIPTLLPIATLLPTFEAQSWDQDGFVLTLGEPTFYTNTIVLGWSIENKTNQDISIPLSYYEGFYAKDDLNNVMDMFTFACYSNLSASRDCQIMGTNLKSGGIIRFAQEIKFDRNTSRATKITMQANNIPHTLYRYFSFSIGEVNN